MRPGLFYRIHMWFIRLITRQVELVSMQLDINKLLNQIKYSQEMMGVPRVYVEPKRKKK